MFKLCAFCSRLKFERGFCGSAESGFKFTRKICGGGKDRFKFAHEICRGFSYGAANLGKFLFQRTFFASAPARLGALNLDKFPAKIACDIRAGSRFVAQNLFKFTREICGRGFQILSVNLPKFERVIYDDFDGRAQNLTQRSSNFSSREAFCTSRQISLKNRTDKIQENCQINRKGAR